ncbi:MAG: hypothetical protein HXY24_10530, partial [Rubrivivax sp.]|nr:hypothetical protein [Rubrivivax sp.]
SVGTLIVIWLIQSFSGPGAIIVVALLAFVASLLFGLHIPGRWKPIVPIVGLGYVGLFCFIAFMSPVQLPIPKSKELSWVLSLTNMSQPEYTRWNPVARVDVLVPTDFTEGVYWIVFGGISSIYQPANHHLRFVTLDGTSITALHEFKGDLSPFRFLDHTIVSAPYQIVDAHPQVLNIGVGGGLDIIMARFYNAASITAIELNSDVVNLLKGPYADFTGRLADDPSTKIITAEGRSFLTRDDAQYDIIQGIGVDNFAALSGGAYVLSESYLYTVDAFELAFSRLTPKGVFSWTRFINDPPREMLRLSGIMAEALRRQGITHPGQHIVIVANETNDSATLLVSRSPFALSTIQWLRDWTAANHFHLLYNPYEPQGTVYDNYLNAPDPRAFEANYPFNISPTTDDNPFFYNYFKWSNLQIIRNNSGDINTRLPIGNLILITVLSFSSLTAIIFIVIPLWRHKRSGLKTPYALPVLAYFSILGLGYIFVEIVLIQHFTLFIGYPTRAITTTIFSMLFFSAIGSLLGQKICSTPQRLQMILMVLTVLIFVYIVALPPLFQSLLRLPDLGRMVLSIVFMAPLALLMGMPFPTGLRQLGVRAPSLIPWAWGMNGVFSVLGSVLVILVSMQTSFTLALASAALFYGIAAIVSTSLWKVQVVETTVETAPVTAVGGALAQSDS